MFTPFAFYGKEVAAIPTNGLILHLDAGNSSSYPGTGTTWYDLSGNGSDGTLTGPTIGYTTTPQGGLVFTQQSSNPGQRVVLPTILGAGDFTICQVVYYDTQPLNEGELFVQYIGGNSGRLLWNLTSSQTMRLFIGGTSKFTSASITTGNYYFLSARRDASTAHININNNAKESGGISSNTPSQTSAQIGTLGQDYNNQWVGNIYVTLVYDRALSDAEITQVYDVYNPIFNF